MLRRVPSKSKITSFVISSAKVANSMTKLAITLLILEPIPGLHTNYRFSKLVVVTAVVGAPDAVVDVVDADTFMVPVSENNSLINKFR